MVVPHLVQYQGSKRNIAPQIVRYLPYRINRLIEPFAGTCALSIYLASKGRVKSFWINDINAPLVDLMRSCIEDPDGLSSAYREIWNGQFCEGVDNVGYFYKIRKEFNDGEKDAARLLFILARVVKGAIRYNGNGEINQSCDRRRFGTAPETVRKNAIRISELLKGRTSFSAVDYREVLKKAVKGDFIYMDPPYQGTSKQESVRDNRYIQGIGYARFVDALEELDERGIDFAISYDGMTGGRKIGRDLPESLGLTHLYINAGLSAQSVLNGDKKVTYESLYLSKGLAADIQQTFDFTGTMGEQ